MIFAARTTPTTKSFAWFGNLIHMTPPPITTLDEIDRNLIGALIVDGRASYASLAPEVGLSQAAVRSRVRRLLDDGVVTVSARVDPRSVGFGIFSFVFITTSGPVRRVTDLLAEIDEAVFVVCLGGRFSAFVEIRCRDYRHLLNVLDRIRSTEGVEEAESLSAIEYLKAGASGIAAEVFGQSVERKMAQPVPGDGPLDDTDIRLIRALVANGRATFADLAPIVGLSQAGVRARVQRLLDDQTVVIHATAGARVLGLDSFSALLISVRGEAQPIAEQLCAMPEFTIVAATSGRCGLVGEVWCRDRDHLLDILDTVRAIDGVADVETAVYLDIVKEQYRLE